jgi:hypothetical protein
MLEYAKAGTVAAVITHKLKTRLAVAWWMIAACRSDGDSEASLEAARGADGVSQVKPAAAPTPTETETLQPGPDSEAVELPRGVSPPAPGPQDERSLRAAVAEPPAQAAKLAPKATALAMADARELEQAEVPPGKPSTPPKLREPSPKPSAAAVPASKPALAKPAAPKPPAAPPRTPAPSVQPEPPVLQEPIAPVPPPAAKATVSVPHTDHVHVEVPAGLQHWLDEDDRMKPWLGKAVSVADTCYANVREDNAGASGVITLSITMHENARPSGRVSSLSGPINSIVMCATTRLMGVKMPLFTGTEGDSYTVRVRFDP